MPCNDCEFLTQCYCDYFAAPRKCTKCTNAQLIEIGRAAVKWRAHCASGPVIEGPVSDVEWEELGVPWNRLISLIDDLEED